MAGIRVTDKQLTRTGPINLGSNVPYLFYVRNMFFAQSEVRSVLSPDVLG